MVAVDPELEACPHCGANAEVRLHDVYRYQCYACGNPRVPARKRWLTTPPLVTQNLKQVRRYHLLNGVWRAASWLGFGGFALTALFGAGTAWSLDFGAPGWTFIAAVASLPLIAAFAARSQSVRQQRQTVSRLEEAWREMATHFFASGRTARTLEDVKAAFAVDHESALRLLAEGEVSAYLRHETPASDAPEFTRARVADQLGDSAAIADASSVGAESFDAVDDEDLASRLAAQPSRSK